jgi:hypothetical protein
LNARKKIISLDAVPSRKPQLLGFIRNLIQAEIHRSCRRSFTRHAMRAPLVIQPLSADFLPDGERFESISNDISLKGMSFINPEPLQHEFVRITFAQFELSAIATVRHNSSIGIDHPLFLVGVEFLDEYYT